ncbi:GNAT family N-acetyltransferase [Jiangella rhizosphaerae]|uniref:GNAT family N-acetyltransferase n=1 Tax=Jiangella rhizosphaerae TaxID=2293569 RepID=A0A418KXP4_9ACTN|nr:GNAT family N-acetyltransferase [Jiangella rhizosphaerae]RIQ36707.1 GNAT family N-acetyltransferase [Jiangella rhizosphaerae]
MHNVSITRPSTPEQALALLRGARSDLGTPISDLVVTDHHLTTAFANRNRRPEWVWTASREGRVAGRVAGWGAPANDQPWILDLFDLGDEPDRIDIMAALLQRAAADLRAGGLEQVELNLFPPAGWRDDPPAALPDLLAAAKAAGFEILVTRRRFRWTPAAGVPSVGDGLRFEPVAGPDDPVLADAYRRTFVGSLDAHTRRSLQTRDAAELAAEELADMVNYAGPVDGWRVAYDTGGALVGLVTGNPGAKVFTGYVGVVPEQRGHRYARELLAWMTRWQAEHGAEKVVGETDDENLPMRRAFEAVGFEEESARIDLVG